MVRGHVLYDREPSASAGPKGFRRTDLDRAGQILTPSNTVLRPLVVLLCHQFPLSLPIPPPCTKTAKHSIPAQATPPLHQGTNGGASLLGAAPRVFLYAAAPARWLPGRSSACRPRRATRPRGRLAAALGRGDESDSTTTSEPPALCRGAAADRSRFSR